MLEDPGNTGELTGLNTGELTGLNTGELTGLNTGDLTGLNTGELIGMHPTLFFYFFSLLHFFTCPISVAQ